MSDKPTVFAIDFGTSNSLLAAASGTRVFEPAPLDPEGSDPSVLRSALYFTSIDDGIFGAGALRAFVENGLRGRLIRSIKRHLASPSLGKTLVGDRFVTLEEIIGRFLGVMRERACAHFHVDVGSVVLGRPARFSNDAAHDALAEQRLRRAAELAGFELVTFCPEPLAAAYDFAEDLREPRLVLVADLGGGTSDYTLVRMRRGGFSSADVLAVGGVAVAGDAIDGAFVRARLAPEFGSTTRYRVPLGRNVLDMPQDLIELLCSPAHLTLLDRKAVLGRIDDIRAGAVAPSDAHERLERFAVVIEDGLGFTLYEAVEASKRALSEHRQTRFAFDYPGAALAVDVERADLERSAKRPLASILAALDDTLQAGGATAEQVEILCLTGGTSRMPLVERALSAKLPRARVRRLKSFHSVVQGLARRAREVAERDFAAA